MKKIDYQKMLSAVALFAVFALLSCGNDLKTPESGDHDMHNHQSKSASEMQESHGRVFFSNFQNGDTLTNPVALSFGVEGMKVHPAGEIIDGTGHHHLLIGLDSVAAGQVVPAT